MQFVTPNGERGKEFVKGIGDDYATNAIGLKDEDGNGMATSLKAILNQGGAFGVRAFDSARCPLGCWMFYFPGRGKAPTVNDEFVLPDPRPKKIPTEPGMSCGFQNQLRSRSIDEEGGLEGGPEEL